MAKTRKPIVVTDAPPDYVRISSGLGDGPPVNLIVLPIVFEGQVLGVIEAGSFSRFTQVHQDFLEQLMETIGVNVNTIIVNSRTDHLLQESQRLAGELQASTGELQARQEELQRSNADLEDKAAQLARQKRDIEIKNAEIEQARQEIEERARQLDLASRYKSQFLANVSHELRTPLNSLLILARLLAENPAENLTAKQVEYANVIHSSGSDLLLLINDILDLSRVEAGKLDVHPEPFALGVAGRGPAHRVRAAGGREAAAVRGRVGPGRARRAASPTGSGSARCCTTCCPTRSSSPSRARWSCGSGWPRPAGPGGRRRVAFSVTDTGIGISDDSLKTIFEAFQQGDGTTSRRYGGTGLGLAISREVAAVLGGRITAQSQPGRGSTFTLYLPVAYRAVTRRWAARPPDRSSGAGPARRDCVGRRTATGRRCSTAARAAAERPVPGLGGDGAGHRPAADPPRESRPAAARTQAARPQGADRGRRPAERLRHHQRPGALRADRQSTPPSGHQGIEALRADPGIDLVLMDVMMPEMDGYTTTAAIREMPQFADLPVIAVTARAMQGDRDKSLAAGASDYVTKPVDTDELLGCISRWLAPRPAGGWAAGWTAAAAGSCRRTRATGSRPVRGLGRPPAPAPVPATAVSRSRCEAPSSCQPVIRPVTTRAGRAGADAPARSARCWPATRPPGTAALSSARVQVVPTAITRRPAARVRFTRSAVAGGTSNHSGSGASPASSDATPACSVTVASSTPAEISSVTRSAVNGRAALGISALPGERANTVW